MLKLLSLIVLCTLVSAIIDIANTRRNDVRLTIKQDVVSKIIYYAILISLILFSGMRTTYNDTTAYTHAFTMTDVSNISLSTLFEGYGGFTLLQQLIYKYISVDPQMLLLVVSVIVNALFFSFIRKHCDYFSESVFLYFIGNYLFSMAGMKQAIAMAISLVAIEKLINRKYIGFVFFILIAMLFHPYIVVLLVLPFISRRVWDRNVVFVLLLGIIAALNLDNVLEFAGMIGKDYDMEEFSDYTINPFRVVIEAIPIFVYALSLRRIRMNNNNEYVTLGINMSLIRFVLIFLGLFWNPIYFARIGTYFSVLDMIVMPMVLNKTELRNEKFGSVVKYAYYLVMTVYFLLDITKLGTISITKDIFGHISFSELFKLIGLE
ncbi:EpsG family protein [Eubacterium coprostanoligenes]|uniref:EpsG family protein n=1 Tax=Eubacterium coprostanoligenes TaxID=290054 RepID=UPI00235363F3|nr:EpsG family protein [Eubacterium coprostanoligenes]MCI6354393.1 EpsG family protein [Eubacterium coprostanoligenes]